MLRKKFYLIIIILAVIGLVVFLGKKLTTKTSLSDSRVLAQTSPSWPQIQGDAQHSGYVPQTVGSPYTELWRWVGAPSSLRVQPIIAEGFVFIPSNDGKLYAVDKNTGQTAWTYTTPSQKPLVSSAGYDLGLVFFGSTDAYVYAIDVATHNLKWRYKTEGSIRSAPTIVSNTVFIPSTDGRMYALDSANGNLRWSYDIGAPILDTCAYYDGKVFFVGMNAKGYALDANSPDPNGTLLWSHQLYGQGMRDRWTVAGNGKVIFTTMPYYPPYPRLGGGTEFIRTMYTESWDYQRQAIRDYLQNDPFMRSTFVLDANTGVESYIAPILYISGGSTSPPSQPVLLPNGNANVIYRWSSGIEPLWGGTTNSAIYLGEMDLTNGDIAQLDDWGTTDPSQEDWNTKVHLISDESSALMRSGDIVYIDSSRGVVGFDLITRQVIPFVTFGRIAGGAYYSAPILFYDDNNMYGHTSPPWPESETWSDMNDAKRPTPVVDDVFYLLHRSILVAVRGTKR